MGVGLQRWKLRAAAGRLSKGFQVEKIGKGSEAGTGGHGEPGDFQKLHAPRIGWGLGCGDSWGVRQKGRGSPEHV